MSGLFSQSELWDLINKIQKQERLDYEAGIRLMKSKDILAIGYMANIVRERMNRNRTYFIVNKDISYTNICDDSCDFCAYGVKKDDPQAFTLSLEQIEDIVRKALAENISEFHVTGGLNSELTFEYYLEILQRVKSIIPNGRIEAYSAVHVNYFSQITGFSVEEILTKLKEAGLDLLSGGITEVFSTRVRAMICKNKVSGERWLEIHEKAHELGMKTNAAMVYGHVESIEERIEHLIRLRELQDRTAGFMSFMPFPFYPENTQLDGNMGVTSTTGFEDLKMLAVSRILLDNFNHIKAFWAMLGPKLAQVSLRFGVDELNGKVVDNQAMYAADGETIHSMSRKALIKIIEKAGRDALLRDSFYKTVDNVKS